VECLSLLARSAQIVDVRISTTPKVARFPELETLPFEYYNQPKVIADFPAERAVDVVTDGVERMSAPLCQLGMSPRPGEVLDQNTLRCPLAPMEEKGLVPVGSPGSFASPIPPRGGINRAIIGSTISVRSTTRPRRYLHVASSGCVAAAQHNTSATFAMPD